MSEEAQPPQEPSIEEILASIRRIISDDGEEAGATPAAEAAAEPVAAAVEAAPVVEALDDDVLDLTERVDAVASIEKPFSRAAEAPMPALKDDLIDDDRLVSEPTAARTTDVLARLAPREADRTADPLPIPPRTLEEVVREMLRPMLREWLDTYLPTIVERSVERELRRMSRRAEELH